MSGRFVLLALVVIGGAGFVQYQRTRTCTLGVSGTDATLTVTGWRATAECDAELERSPRLLYRRDAATDASVLCEQDRNGKHYVVRDRGVMMIVGRTLCAGLSENPDGPLRIVPETR